MRILWANFTKKQNRKQRRKIPEKKNLEKKNISLEKCANGKEF